MDLICKWFAALVAVIIGLAGLFVSSESQDPRYYYGGLVVAALAVIYVFLSIRCYYDKKKKACK